VGKKRIGGRKYINMQTFIAVAEYKLKGKDATDLFFARSGYNFSFFSEDLIFCFFFIKKKEENLSD
jgi:hypothetical protein